MTLSRTHIAFLASTALVALASSAIANPLSFSNESGGTAKAYGQLSPTYLGFNDGEETSGQIADNGHSNSRVGLRLAQPAGSDTQLGFWFETALGAPQTSSFSQDVEPLWEWDKTKLRHVDLYVGGSWGRLTIGQGSMATDGAATIDKSETTMGSTVTLADTAGGFFFRQKDGELSGVSIASAFKDLDGDRKGRIRYDTPDWNGFKFAAAYGEEILNPDDGKTLYDIAGRYDGQNGDFEYSAALGYGWTEYDDDTIETGRTAMGSLSALHVPTGLNGTFAGGSQVDGGSYWYVKGGWLGDFWQHGFTAVSADYYSGSDLASDGSTSEAWGVEFTQMFDAANIEAYVAYNGFTFSDNSDVRYQDANSTLAGLRWKF